MDEFKIAAEYLDKIFTLEQQVALIIITLGVIGLTQAFKNIYFGIFPTQKPAKKKAILWLFALLAGIGGGYAGYKVGIPKQPTWFWIFCMCTTGASAIGIFKVLIEIMWPRLKAAPSIIFEVMGKLKK